LAIGGQEAQVQAAGTADHCLKPACPLAVGSSSEVRFQGISGTGSFKKGGKVPLLWLKRVVRLARFTLKANPLGIATQLSCGFNKIAFKSGVPLLNRWLESDVISMI
jgi:hypothetical protein